jgi:hypothetical protein
MHNTELMLVTLDYIEFLAVRRDRTHVDVTSVEHDFGDIVSDGFYLEGGGSCQSLCSKVNSEGEVDVVRLDLAEVRL